MTETMLRRRLFFVYMVLSVGLNLVTIPWLQVFCQESDGIVFLLLDFLCLINIFLVIINTIIYDGYYQFSGFHNFIIEMAACFALLTASESIIALCQSDSTYIFTCVHVVGGVSGIILLVVQDASNPVDNHVDDTPNNLPVGLPDCAGDRAGIFNA